MSSASFPDSDYVHCHVIGPTQDITNPSRATCKSLYIRAKLPVAPVVDFILWYRTGYADTSDLLPLLFLEWALVWHRIDSTSRTFTVIVACSLQRSPRLTSKSSHLDVRCGDAGYWLFECESETHGRVLLNYLQRSGCMMRGLDNRYSLGACVAVGGTARVYVAEDRYAEGAVVAVKVVHAVEDNVKQLRTEVEILRRLFEPNLLQFQGLYEVKGSASNLTIWAIVTEFLSGGELFDEVRRCGPLGVRRTKRVMIQLFQGLRHLHERKIVHRDIKTENVILVGTNDDRIRLVDFGLASYEHDEEAMKVKCGSPGYIAPEVLRGSSYNCLVDCFSVGVLQYILLAGRGPFLAVAVAEMLVLNWKCQIDYSPVAEPDREFLRQLLSKFPEHRITAAKALEHEWLAGVSFEPCTGGAAASSSGVERQSRMQAVLDESAGCNTEQSIAAIRGVDEIILSVSTHARGPAIDKFRRGTPGSAYDDDDDDLDGRLTID